MKNQRLVKIYAIKKFSSRYWYIPILEENKNRKSKEQKCRNVNGRYYYNYPWDKQIAIADYDLWYKSASWLVK